MHTRCQHKVGLVADPPCLQAHKLCISRNCKRRVSNQLTTRCRNASRNPFISFAYASCFSTSWINGKRCTYISHINDPNAAHCMTTMPDQPSTPSKAARTHSRQISSEAGTEFGTPESTFPTDSPTVGETTRMVGLGLTNGHGQSNGSKEGPSAGEAVGGDVFGNGHRLDLDGNENEDANRDHVLDEVDQFFNEADDDYGPDHDHATRESSFDASKTRLELNTRGGPRRTDSSASSFAQSPGSHASDPLLEVLDNDDDDEGEDEEMEMFEDGDEDDFDPHEPLVGRRGRRGRRRWEGEERRQEATLLEVSERSPQISY